MAVGVITTIGTGAAGAEGTNELATADCVSQRTEQLISGAEPGGTTSGSDAIFAFEYAYYVQRSGTAARALVADDSPDIASSEMIQRGIDEQLPVGSRYCVWITPDGRPDTWDVEVTQEHPNGQRMLYRQDIATRSIAGGTLITGLTSE
ncbi:hypothetical protein ACL02S_00085 [Nocardia sp. 004]|uniref:hypothetical protein n=1 Tax=Nocardia sp. 004 TaxID=3385978 RepID=UPI00399F66D3